MQQQSTWAKTLQFAAVVTTHDVHHHRSNRLRSHTSENVELTNESQEITRGLGLQIGGAAPDGRQVIHRGEAL